MRILPLVFVAGFGLAAPEGQERRQGAYCVCVGLCLLEHKLINATKSHQSLILLQALLPLTVSRYPMHFLLHRNLTQGGSWVHRLRGNLCC
jgi:hypothetical protein